MSSDVPKSMVSGSTKFSGKCKKKQRTKGGKMAQKKKQMQYRGKAAAAVASKVGDSKKERRLIRKRVREYNSDDEEENDDDKRQLHDVNAKEKDVSDDDEANSGSSGSDGDEVDMEKSDDDSDYYDGEMQQGITKFTDGCRAFRMAFMKIMKKSSSEPLGPVLSANKKLVAEKLAEELAEEKGKMESRKEKKLVREKGHVQPANFLDSKEKFLISVATKGVVKLFNAVNKAQKTQQGLNPAKSKDAKIMAKRRKDVFLSELRKPIEKDGGAISEDSQAKNEANDVPHWAPLQDGYMLTNPKLKDWDKMTDPAPASDAYKPLESSSDED